MDMIFEVYVDGDTHDFRTRARKRQVIWFPGLGRMVITYEVNGNNARPIISTDFDPEKVENRRNYVRKLY